jgi:hypothetical protein
LANCAAQTLTPPLPGNRTVDPASTWPAFMAFQAAVAAIGKVAACSKA